MDGHAAKFFGIRIQTWDLGVRTTTPANRALKAATNDIKSHKWHPEAFKIAEK